METSGQILNRARSVYESTSVPMTAAEKRTQTAELSVGRGT